jgi:pimeloyl-ACP methyl ester carboxylesterase
MEILLVHGAWHGAWCWAPLQYDLTRRGLRSRAIDLPGHGARRRPGWLTTWRGYVDAVVEAAGACDGPPLVVGHSMGGGVITAASERAPDRFAGLVYLAAFLPLDGESVLSLARREPPMPGTRPNLLRGEMAIAPEAARNTFFHDCPDPDRWTAQLQGQALRPVRTPVRVTPARFGRVERFYIRCLRDRALSPAFQQAMIARAPMRETFTMDTGHSPFLARPDELATILARIAGSLA